MIPNNHHGRKAREYHRKHSRTLFGQIEPANLPDYMEEHAKHVEMIKKFGGITERMRGTGSIAQIILDNPLASIHYSRKSIA